MQATIATDVAKTFAPIRTMTATATAARSISAMTQTITTIATLAKDRSALMVTTWIISVTAVQGPAAPMVRTRITNATYATRLYVKTAVPYPTL